MKKNTFKQRLRSIELFFKNLTKKRTSHKKKRAKKEREVIRLNDLTDKRVRKGVNLTIDKQKKITIYLPEVMNFSDQYENTALYLNTIRELCKKRKRPHGSYKLVSVNFDGIKQISSSAALVLTAEISRWECVIRKQLNPKVSGWDPFIFKKFQELGFFNLFRNCIKFANYSNEVDSDINFVEYIKGIQGEKIKAREFGEKLDIVLGRDIHKWKFLHGGLTEAIINVGHHAYPSSKISKDEGMWFIGGAFNRRTKELKVTFYDQGIGIPKSLPASKLWERALVVLDRFSMVERKRDEVLLKAAMELDRSRTYDDDRGKGLQDMLEFVKQRKDGYLSILSSKGLYKYTVERGVGTVKTQNFIEPILGTLIIWRVILDERS